MSKRFYFTLRVLNLVFAQNLCASAQALGNGVGVMFFSHRNKPHIPWVTPDSFSRAHNMTMNLFKVFGNQGKPLSIEMTWIKLAGLLKDLNNKNLDKVDGETLGRRNRLSKAPVSHAHPYGCG